MNDSILLFGGNSDERLVSVASAQNLAKKFSFSERWFIGLDGSIARVSQDELIAHQRPFEIQFKSKDKPFAKSIADAVPQLAGKAVFIGLHGTEGEDGTIQTLFEQNKVAFSGSGAKASRLCFNKLDAKKVVAQAKILVAPQISFSRGSADQISKTLTEFFKQNGPIVAKPVESGSSFGLHIIGTEAAIAPAAEQIAKSSYEIIMAEKFLKGRELTVGVMDRASGLMALPPSEVVLESGHNFDYQGKYLGKGSTEITPANLTEAEKVAAQKVAIESHKSLGCYGYTRTDMILTPTGPYFLETNTLPGLSTASFVPQQLEAIEVPVAAFVEEQLQLARKRY